MAELPVPVGAAPVAVWGYFKQLVDQPWSRRISPAHPSGTCRLGRARKPAHQSQHASLSHDRSRIGVCRAAPPPPRRTAYASRSFHAVLVPANPMVSTSIHAITVLQFSHKTAVNHLLHIVGQGASAPRHVFCVTRNGVLRMGHSAPANLHTTTGRTTSMPLSPSWSNQCPPQGTKRWSQSKLWHSCHNRCRPFVPPTARCTEAVRCGNPKKTQKVVPVSPSAMQWLCAAVA
jgi:hypothetical protein